MSEALHKKYRVLVYGTLMKGERNHHYMGQAKFITSDLATCDTDFVMLQFPSTSSPGDFSPGVERVTKKQTINGAIVGEVYEVDENGLASMDDLEQNGIHYKREMVSLTDGSNAWIYIHVDKQAKSIKDPEFVLFNPETKIFSWKRRSTK